MILLTYFNKEIIFDSFIQKLGFRLWISISIIIIFKLIFLFLTLYILSISCKRIIKYISKYIIKYKSYYWYNILYKNKVFNSFAYFFPLLFTSIITEFIFNTYSWIILNLEKLFSVIFMLVILQFSIRIINSITQIVTDENKNVAINSLSQLLKICFITLCILIIISIIYNIELSVILTGLGTLTAVIVLVFRDTILGFISGIQIASTKMIKVGDWISIPKHDIEGNVIDFSLFSAKIENFDKTISTVPTYDLISTSITNYENIHKKNIRRIKHAILFNIKSFQFCDVKTINSLRKISYIKEYINNNKIFKKKFNQNLINISIYRKYITYFLLKHPDISKKETLMVRYLKINPYGLPLEIYCFTNTSDWIKYENIQANIFDHFLTIAKEFNLEVVQTNK